MALVRAAGMQAARLLQRTGSGGVAASALAQPWGPGSTSWLLRSMAQTSQQPAGTSTRPAASADAGAYRVEVSIKAFEQRYLQHASAVVRDLLMLSLAPSTTAGPLAPSGWSPPTSLKQPWGGPQLPPSPANLFQPIEHRMLRQNWRRSRFTVVRSPHIDKPGMEQFEIRRYKAVVCATTSSARELQWFLTHLKTYDFTGVQLEVQLTSVTHISPPMQHMSHGAGSGAQPQQQQGQQQQHQQQGASVLSRHIAATASPCLRPALASPSADAHRDELSVALAALRRVLHLGLSERRERLAASDSAYQQWHYENRIKGSAGALPPAARHPSMLPSAITDPLPLAGLDRPDTASAAAAFSAAGGAAIRLRQLLGSSACIPEPGTAGASVSAAGKHGALLSAIDAVLLDLCFTGVSSSKAGDSASQLAARLVPGQQGAVPAPLWLMSVRKVAEYEQLLAKATHEAQLASAYADYGLFAHALGHILLKIWTQHTASQLKQQLALPPQPLREKQQAA